MWCSPPNPTPPVLLEIFCETIRTSSLFGTSRTDDSKQSRGLLAFTLGVFGADCVWPAVTQNKVSSAPQVFGGRQVQTVALVQAKHSSCFVNTLQTEVLFASLVVAKCRLKSDERPPSMTRLVARLPWLIFKPSASMKRRRAHTGSILFSFLTKPSHILKTKV